MLIKNLIKIKEKGLTFDEFFYLLILNGNEEYLFPKDSFSSVKTSLFNKKYLTWDYKITVIGKEILKDIKFETSTKTVSSVDLRDRMIKKLKELTGKKQVVGFGGKYFIPTDAELTSTLNRFWKVYPKYTDMNKIEKIIMSHIEKCAKTQKFAPAVQYFILKEKVNSPLAAAYESFDEKPQSDENLQKSINPDELF